MLQHETQGGVCELAGHVGATEAELAGRVGTTEAYTSMCAEIYTRYKCYSRVWLKATKCVECSTRDVRHITAKDPCSHPEKKV